MSLFEKMLHRPLNEETTMSNIAYLPSGVGAVSIALKSLAKLKKDWNIEILEDAKGKKVVFEDQLSIFVPLQWWSEFGKMFESPLEKGSISLLSYLAEAMADELEDKKGNLKTSILRLFDEKLFKVAEKSANVWRSEFGIKKILPADVVVEASQKERSIRKLIHNLDYKYADARGQIDLLIEAIGNRSALSAFDIFKDKDFLYGSRILSEYAHVKMFYEYTVDFAYMLKQSILVEDEIVLGELEGNKNVRIVKHTIYPAGQVFENGFFRVLKDTVKGFAE